MSARYVPLPDENYKPSVQRIIDGAQKAGSNRQAQGMVELDAMRIDHWLEHLQAVYDHAQAVYEMGLNFGIPKELARLPVPVARYSRMRVSANLRNWLQFLELRGSQHAPNAQWEIRQYADAVGGYLASQFPRTMALFKEENT
jgi:thymidylate synthase (FAD)